MVKEGKNGGYRFAVTFLAASGTILYVIYNYLQNTPVGVDCYILIVFLISGLLLSMLGFGSHVVVKGYSLESQNDFFIKCLKPLSHLYEYSHYVFFIAMTIPLLFVFCCAVAGHLTDVGYFTTRDYVVITSKLDDFAIFMIILIIITMFVFACLACFSLKIVENVLENSKFHSKILLKILKKYLKYLSAVLGLLSSPACYISMLWFMSFCFVLIYAVPFHGHVTADVESVYYTNNAQIPVLIQVTGPNTGVYILLYKEKNGNSTTYINHIGPMEPTFLGPEGNLEEKRNLYSNNELVGNYLGNGEYCVFINTTNLTTGYYEVICMRDLYSKKTCEGKSFYLVNKDQQS